MNKPATTQFRAEIIITRAWCPKCNYEMIGGKLPPPSTSGAGVAFADDTHHECSKCGHKEQYDRGYPFTEHREVPIPSDGMTREGPI